jgi:uncharacterized protein YggE
MIKSAGEVETLPDMASFQIDLSCLEPTVKASKDCLVKKSNELTAKLLSFGVEKKDILTAAVSLNKSYTWKNNSNVFEGYRSSTTTYITVRNLDKLDEIYTELLENRNLELGGLSYAHSKMDSLQNEAYMNALKKSAVLADKLLTGLPEKKKEILKIGNVAISSSNPQADKQEEVTMEASMDGFAANLRNQKSISMNQGTVKVYATLYAEYLIK